MDRISTKVGGGVARAADDPRVVDLLIAGLQDTNRRVQRAAARGLRPWIAEDPSIIDRALKAYAGHLYDGTYSHNGLYEPATDMIWIPRFAALRGHAALLADANTDRFFRFEFFVPGQGPGWIPDARATGNVVLCAVPEWSYSRQQLIPSHDERLLAANRKEQERYGRTVTGFYDDASLSCDVRVHRVEGGGGHHRMRELDIAHLPGRSIRGQVAAR